MKIKVFDKDIETMCVNATSFPSGVQAAHEKLHSLIPYEVKRGYYGISWADKHGNIIYKAAAGVLQKGEAAQHKCETFIIRKGKYLSETINNFMQNIPAIAKTFSELLKDPRLDKNGYCLEVYVSNIDMHCMVKLDDTKAGD